MLKPEAYSFAYGVLLGTMFTTHVHVSTVFSVVLYATLQGNAWTAFFLALILGLSRGLTLLLLHLFGGGDFEALLERLDSKAHAVHVGNGVALTAAGSLLVVLGALGS